MPNVVRIGFFLSLLRGDNFQILGLLHFQLLHPMVAPPSGVVIRWNAEAHNGSPVISLERMKQKTSNLVCLLIVMNTTICMLKFHSMGMHYHRSLFCCNTNAMSSIPNLSLSSLFGDLSFSLMAHINLTILISAR